MLSALLIDDARLVSEQQIKQIYEGVVGNNLVYVLVIDVVVQDY